MKIKLFLIAVLFCLIANVAFASGIDTLLADTVLSGAFVGVMVKDINKESVVFSHNADLLFTPASNNKLFTIAAALEFLGPRYRFKTSFLTTGHINNKGILNGDLIIVGGGDPLISGRFRKSPPEILEFWADSLKARGLKEIKGNLAIDNTFFEDDELGVGWPQDELSYEYACPISALSFNNNCVDLRVYPGEDIGKKCRIVFDPQTDYIDTINNTITLPAGSISTFDLYRHPGTNKVDFKGGVAIDDKSGYIAAVSIKNPPKYCAYIFQNILARKNIRLDGKIKEIRPRQKLLASIRVGYLKLFSWESDSLGAVVSIMGKDSQNFFAEQTLKTIGAEVSGTGSYPVASQIVRNWLDKMVIGSSDINYVDGSGLSYMNMVKPSAIIRLLEYMSKSANHQIFYGSLAIPVKDRGVRDRVVGHPLAEMMHVKTGYLPGVSTFSGYMTTGSGRLLAFSIMVNHHSAPLKDITQWEDKVCAYFMDNY